MKHRSMVMAVLSFGLISFGTLAFAGSVTSEKDPVVSGYSAIVSHLSHQKMHLVKTVPTGVSGLSGLIAENSAGKKQLAFGLDGKYLIPGPIIGADGKMLNAKIATEYGLIPKALPVSAVALKAISAPGFILGKSGPLMAVFMDPNCIYCHKFYEDVQSDIQAGKFRLKVVPVGFLKPSSFPKAVAIMSAKDPATAWAQDESHFNAADEEGGATPAKNLHTPVASEIQANTELLGATGEMATPTLVYCTKSGKAVLDHGFNQGLLGSLGSGDVGDLLPTGACKG